MNIMSISKNVTVRSKTELTVKAKKMFFAKGIVSLALVFATISLTAQTTGWSNKKLAGTLDASKWTELQILSCSDNRITALKIDNSTKLKYLDCFNNSLLLSDLFIISEAMENNVAHWKALGTQTLSEKTATIGVVLKFPVPQDIFNGKYTQFAVIKDGLPVAGDNYTVTDGKITFNTLGTYTVKMFNEAIISEGYPAEVIFDVMVGVAGIEENVLSNIKIYPNPTIDNFVVESEGVVSIKLYDMLGKEVLTQTAVGKTEINISYLPKGIYNVRILSDGKVIGNSKIVKY